jgi:hypothetical protein
MLTSKLAGAERLLKNPKVVRGALKALKVKYRWAGSKIDAYGHSIEQAVANAADRFDENYVSPKTGKKAKFTSYIWSTISLSFIRFRERDLMGGAASLDAPIKKTGNGGDKQQTLIDAYEDRPEQNVFDAYADVTGRCDGEAGDPLTEIADRSDLNDDQRLIFDNELAAQPLSGKELAAQLGKSPAHVSQQKGKMIEKLQATARTGSYAPGGQKSVITVPSDDFMAEYLTQVSLNRDDK